MKEGIKLQSYEKMFETTDASKDNSTELNIDELHEFKNHPFKVIENEAMQELIESIQEQGVIIPIIVRVRIGGGYEIIAGHRRTYASKKAGKDTIPAIIMELTDKEAIDIMFDTNIQRPELLPSELAFGYKMKYEAEKQQGSRTDLTSCQVGVKSVANKEARSIRTIQRYIALTNLISNLLEKLDNKKIPFMSCVELSYLSATEQVQLFQYMEEYKIVPSVEQAEYLHKMSKDNKLTIIVLKELFQKKKNEKVKVVLNSDRLNKYFNPAYSKEDMENVIMKLLEDWSKKEERNNNTDIKRQESIETLENGKYMPG